MDISSVLTHCGIVLTFIAWLWATCSCINLGFDQRRLTVQVHFGWIGAALVALGFTVFFSAVAASQ